MFLKFKSQKFSFSPHIAGLQTQIDFSSSNPNRFTPQIFDVSLHTLNLKSLMDTLPSCFPTSGHCGSRMRTICFINCLNKFGSELMHLESSSSRTRILVITYKAIYPSRGGARNLTLIIYSQRIIQFVSLGFIIHPHLYLFAGVGTKRQNFELPSVADHPLGPATDHRLGSYALLTRPPLETPLPVRLACVKHAASVHPEPRFMLQVEGVAVSMHEVVRIERMCEDIH
ncbi:hypothetical protein P8452_14671 [Trifolium repens]|nr:hypothetical protein P8452_14671 [Trifolium repens]